MVKTFFGRSLAVVFGNLLTWIIVVILILLLAIGATMNNDDIDENSIMTIKFNNPIKEHNSSYSLKNALNGDHVNISLWDINQALIEGAKNENIKALYLDLTNFSAGAAQTEELRNYIKNFKLSNKKIYAFAESYSEKAYFLASVADEIVVPAAGNFEFNGLEIQSLYYKKMFDKVGVKPEIFRVGTFKSAVEPFMQDSMSKANKLQLSELLSDLNDFYLGEVAKARSVNFDSINLWNKKMLIQDVETALSKKLITKVMYFAELEDLMKNDLVIQKLNYVSYKKLVPGLSPSFSSNKIAVIFADGEINSGKSKNDVIGSESLIKQLRKAKDDESIKAVVLRINSPGGSALASDMMWYEINELKKKKKVVASMSNLAASGGYYMAMAADTIVANKTTITGSIGVFGLLFDASLFLQNTIGVTTNTVKTGEFSDIGSFMKPFSVKEKEIIQNQVNHIYDDFTSKAAKGRNVSQAEIKAVAEGRVWSGNEAVKINLVDITGDINEAIRVACTMANVNESDFQLVTLPEHKPSLVENLLKNIGDGDDEEMSSTLVLQNAQSIIQQYEKVARMKGVQMKLDQELIVE